MQFEYVALVLMTFFYLLAFLPSSYAKLKLYGGKWLASNRTPPVDKVMLPWGQRAERAYTNLKDYFPGYVVAILLLGQLGKFDQTTSLAAGLYVVSRMGHMAAYIAGSVRLRFATYVIAMISNFYLLVKCLI